MDESADLTTSVSNPASNQSSVSAPGSAGHNSNVFKLSSSARSSRSSRFFPNPMFESRNSTDLDPSVHQQHQHQQQQQQQQQHQNIFTQSPLVSSNRRTTIPNTPSTSFNYSSPSGLNDSSQHNNDIMLYDQNLKAGSSSFQSIPPISMSQNYTRTDTLFNSSTPTPQYDPPNVSYFDNKFNFIPHHLQQQQQQHVSNSNNLSYSTLFGEQNSSTILSPQFSNNSSTPLHFNTDGQQPATYNSNNNYQLSYHVNENSQILPTSSFVDRDLSLDNDFEINDLSELSFADSRAESPSPSPNSSPKKGIFQQNQNVFVPNTKIPVAVKHKSKQKQKHVKEKEKLIFAGSHSPFTPTLNLTNLKYNKISLDSPHTPLAQQNINQLLVGNNINNAKNNIDPVTPLDVKADVDNSDDIFNEMGDSFTSPSSSNFPSPSIPSLPLFEPEEKTDQLSVHFKDSDKIATKSRILHFIHHIITRHNIVYRTYLVSVPSQTPTSVLLDLIETVFYPLGVIISAVKVSNIDTEESKNDLAESNGDSTSTHGDQTVDSSQFSRFRVTVSVADSGLTTYSNPNTFNSTSNNYSRHGRFNNNEKDSQTQQQQQQQSQHSGPWKSIRYTLDGRDVKMLIFYEGDSKESTHATLEAEGPSSGDVQIFNSADDDVLKSAKANAQSSMSKSLTTNNKLDVCWYPEGFSSTFHRRGVNNFMFVRELQSKMIVNRTRVSGGGIIEMGEFRVSVPIEEIGFLGESGNNTKSTTNGTNGTGGTNGERLKRSFLVNIDLRELDGKNINANNSNNNNNAHTHAHIQTDATHTNGSTNTSTNTHSHAHTHMYMSGSGNTMGARKSNSGVSNSSMNAASTSYIESTDLNTEGDNGAYPNAGLNSGSGSSSASGNNNTERTGHGYHNHSYNHSHGGNHIHGNRYGNSDSLGSGAPGSGPNPGQTHSPNSMHSQGAVDASGNGRGGRGGKLGKKREGRGGFRYGSRRGGGGGGSRGSFRGKQHMATHT
ncbi:hypothetical protein PMKS-001265 [Pichia membranifaciens]|uniref:Uncharacterized protein n=1 Tax=Pichia membranifaciens TaxID=4926 RepID=A0A1Q2YE12_9ASCO|nr:hypothetical protein PMKS-001265 [Pichia membranifaciens]